MHEVEVTEVGGGGDGDDGGNMEVREGEVEVTEVYEG